jgi:hypothetical protein
VARAAGWLYAVASAVVIAFQIALAAGAPWGEWAMAGRFSGALPAGLRIAALLQGAMVAGLAMIVLSRAGVAWRAGARTSRRLVWLAVGVSAVSLVLNLITPSTAERAVWAPIAGVLLATSAIVAATPAAPSDP